MRITVHSRSSDCTPRTRGPSTRAGDHVASERNSPAAFSSRARATSSGASGPSEISTKICDRSEEHTSELQSRLHLVCRLLLEKKKKKNNKRRIHIRELC